MSMGCMALPHRGCIGKQYSSQAALTCLSRERAPVHFAPSNSTNPTLRPNTRRWWEHERKATKVITRSPRRGRARKAWHERRKSLPCEAIGANLGAPNHNDADTTAGRTEPGRSEPQQQTRDHHAFLKKLIIEACFPADLAAVFFAFPVDDFWGAFPSTLFSTPTLAFFGSTGSVARVWFVLDGCSGSWGVLKRGARCGESETTDPGRAYTKSKNHNSWCMMHKDESFRIVFPAGSECTQCFLRGKALWPRDFNVEVVHIQHHARESAS